jgi:UDP:flavonoid glycosyltransferase YjiC (YdhE family)
VARILLGWEIGGGQGHKVRLGRIAQLLVRRGHEPFVALQRTDIGANHQPGGIRLLRAPLWPGLVRRVPPDPERPSASMGDILARLGLSDPATTEAMVRGWDELLAATRPDAVIADYAPMLLSAARGRVPALAVSGGFAAPPPELEAFPSLSGRPKQFDEARLLEAANAGLAARSRDPLPALPRLFAADAALVAPFAALDPYRRWRKGAAYASELPDPLPPVRGAGAQGGELFVYGGGRFLRSGPLWEVEPRFVPLQAIATRSCLVVNHGGLGMVSSAMLTGLPVAILHYDLEKRLIAEAATGLGLGIRAQLGGIAAEPLAAALVRAAEDERLAAHARSLADRLRGTLGPPLTLAAADWIDAVT